MNSLAPTINDLFLTHRQSLIHAIFRIVDCPETAEDLAQEAYLKMMHAAETQDISIVARMKRSAIREVRSRAFPVFRLRCIRATSAHSSHR